MTSSAKSEWSGDDWDEHYIANCLGSQRLVAYLREPRDKLRLVLEDNDGGEVVRTVIEAKKIGNRTGPPKTASTWRYTVSRQDFEVTIRAVWHDGKLFEPLKTHCRVTFVKPNTEEARRAYNDWLRNLTLIA
jgi:hypothetical protein